MKKRIITDENEFEILEEEEFEEIDEIDLSIEDFLKIEEVEINKNQANQKKIIEITTIKDQRAILMRINSVDLVSLDNSEKSGLLNAYFSGIKGFEGKFKIVSITNTYKFTEQKNRIESLKKKNTNKNILIELEREKNKLIKFENNLQVSFFVFIYGDKENIISKYNKFTNRFNNKFLSLSDLTKTEVLETLKRINNL